MKTARFFLFLSGFAMLAAAYSTVRAQQPAEPASVLGGVYTTAQAMRGAQVFSDNCASCHGATLMGSDTGGPPLTGPDFINGWKDMSVGALYSKISTDMPSNAPGTLTPAQYSDVLAYVLNYNKYPAGQIELPMSADALAMVKMAEAPAGAAAAPAASASPTGAPAAGTATPQSVLDGVFTDAQAMRGQQVFTMSCSTCHGPMLLGSDTGGPPLTGADFINGWKDMSVGALYSKISMDMPSDAPGSLSQAQYADVLAYVLSFNKYPAGSRELPADGTGLGTVKMAEPRQ